MARGQRLPFEREKAVPLEVAEGAVVPEDVEAVRGALEGAARLVAPILAQADVSLEDLPAFGGPDLPPRWDGHGVDPVSGLTVGTEEPIQHGGGFLDMNAATVTTARAVTVDTALLQASAPLLNLSGAGGAQLTTSSNVIDLTSKSKVTHTGTFVALDQSRLIGNNAALANVAGGSKLTVAGNLVSLTNGATLTLLSGPLLNVDRGTFVSITGALVNFGGTGGNVINLTNTFPPTGYVNGVPVFSSLSGTTGFTFTNATPLVGLNSLGAIKINGAALPNGATEGVTGSLIAIQSGGGKVKVGP